jgi:hypothetical protein
MDNQMPIMTGIQVYIFWPAPTNYYYHGQYSYAGASFDLIVVFWIKLE